MELDDVGKEVIAYDTRGQPYKEQRLVKVVLGIKAPRGRMFLFGEGNIEDKCKAIRAFIEAHLND